MKLLIAGSRSITNIDLEKYIPKETTLIISGGAIGVDTLAERYADRHKISKYIKLPRYDLYGRSAPLKRNEEIANACDKALVIWDGKSRGSKYTIDYLKKIGKEVVVVIIGNERNN